MEMSRSSDRGKELRWVRLLQEKRASGQSVAAFCRQRRIPVHQFYWWQRQLRHHSSRESDTEERTLASSPAFVPVRVAIPSPVIEVVHPRGCVVRLVAGVDGQALRTVIAALDGGEA
jgi:hypothetical protein